MPAAQTENWDSRRARFTCTMRVATFIVAVFASRQISCDPETQKPPRPADGGNVPGETGSVPSANTDFAQDPKELWDYSGDVQLGTTVFVRIVGRDGLPRNILVRISPDENALYFNGHCFRLRVSTRIGEFDAQIRQVTIEQGKVTLKAGLQLPVFGSVTGSAVWDEPTLQKYTEELADGTKEVRFTVQIPVLGERSARIVPAQRVSESAP